MPTDVNQLQSLTPLVAVCIVFTAALSGLVAAFLTHLSKKDERTAEVVRGVQMVLQEMKLELQRLAMNDNTQTEILQRMLMSTFSGRQSAAEPRQPTLFPFSDPHSRNSL